MDPRLLDYYNQELRHVREMAAEFAQEFPKIAGRLGISGIECADPYIERLLEGFAYVSARIQIKIDAEFPRFTQHLLEMVYPQYLCPMPSMAIAEFAPEFQEADLAQGYPIPRGTALNSRRSAGNSAQCEFRTAHEVRLWPIEVVSADYRAYSGGLPPGLAHPRPPRAILRLRLRATAGLTFSKIRCDSLPVFLAGTDLNAHKLYEYLLATAMGYAVVSPDGNRMHGAWQPASNIRELGFDDDQALLPIDSRSFQGYRLLQEYLAFPQRLLFVDFRGLAATAGTAATDEIEIVVPLSSYDRVLEGSVSSRDFALYCAPAINLFPKRADRIHLSDQFSEQHVVADRTRPMDFEVYQVTRVEGYGEGVEVRQIFQPFYSVLDSQIGGSAEAFFTVRRAPRLLSEKQRRTAARTHYVGNEVFISLVDSAEAPYSSELRQLAVETLCTNRDIAMSMPIGGGQGDFTLDVSAPVSQVRCVKGPTTPHSSHPVGDSSWRLISLLSQNYLSMLDTNRERGAEALREILALHATQADSEMRRHIDALRSVRTRQIVRRLPTAGPVTFGRGIEATIEIDETALGGTGAFLMGSALREYFARHVSLNSFVETALNVMGRGEVMRWRAQIGSRPIV